MKARALHLLALSSFGIAQPMFQRLSDNPVYFAVQGFHGVDVVLYSIGLVLLFPALLMVIELVAALIHRRVATIVHQLFVGLLVYVILVQALRSLHSTFTVGAALILAVFFARIYRVSQSARTFLTICALAPVLFVTLFLFKVPLAALSAPEPRSGTMPAVDARTSVVLVIFDEFAPSTLMTESGAIDAVRYANFGALARTSTWYRNATTVSDATDWAVPAILTGQRSRREQLPVVADHPRNVFTLLGRSYDLHAFQAVTRLCPASVCPDSAPSLRSRMRTLLSDLGATSLLRMPVHEGDWSTPQDELSDFFETLGPSRRPQLDLLHVLLPHEPWEYLPSGRTYYGGRVIDGYVWDRWTNDRRVVDQGYERYLLQLRYVDGVLGRIVSRLRAAGLWNRSLVIVTADHGVSFRPGGHRRLVDSTNISDIAPIPLFVKQPGQREGTIDDRSARTIDILPTIADVLGIRVPWRLEGHSLLTRGRSFPSEIDVTSFTRDVVTTSWSKIEKDRARTIAHRVRLFGLGTDSLFAAGRDRRLVGDSVDEFPVWKTKAIRGHIDQPSSTLFDPGSSYSPSRVIGTVEGVLPRGGLKIAVAVNGRIGSITEGFSTGGATRFSTFVPERAFRPGQNAIILFALRTDRRGHVALARIGSKGSDSSLEAARG
jgi:hypothetical protein